MAKLFTNIGLVVIASVLTLFALEGLTRAYLWGKDSFLLDREISALAEAQGVSEASFNIYYLGGSTVRGVIPKVTIPEIVEYGLGGKVGGSPVRSVNLASDGKDLGYNLTRLKRIIKGKDEYRPSLVVIYSGHNEFLKYHRPSGKTMFSGAIGWLSEYSVLVEKLLAVFEPYRLELADRKFFDVPLLGPDAREDVIRQYQQGLKEAVRELRENRIPLVISTVAGNYADWQPNRSTFCADSPDRDEFALLMRNGQVATEQGRYSAAVSMYEQALALCDSFAETHYRLAGSYAAQREYDLAAQEYLKATEYDAMPIRALPSMNDFIRNLARDEGVIHVDSISEIRKRSEKGLIGFDLMVDAHHPNKLGYIVIGQAIARAIGDAFDPGSYPAGVPDWQGAVDKFNLTREERFDVLIWNGRWLTRMATWRYDTTERLERAERVFAEAMDLYPDRHEPYLGLAMVGFLKKNVATAQGHLEKAREINSDAVAAYLEQPWVSDVVQSAR